jgi:SUKH-3 immunity protein
MDAMSDEALEQGPWQFVPGAEPIKVIPVWVASEWDGFRIAQNFDGVTEDRRPRIGAERGYVTDPDQRARLLEYLGSGASAVSSAGAGVDLLDSRRRFAVWARYYTDGVWIWNAGAEYYLRWHHVAPEPDFRRHIAANCYQCPPVPADRIAAAKRAVLEALQKFRTEREAWVRSRGGLPEGDPDRFPPEVNQRLLLIGWHKGRDVSATLGPWLARQIEELGKFRLVERGYLPYEPLAPATAALREFGGLVSRDQEPGVTAARTPFVMYPRDGRDDLDWFVPDVAELAKRLGKRLFQVGVIGHGDLALVVAEDGSVYAAGPINLYLGDTFDAALVGLVAGYKAQRA